MVQRCPIKLDPLIQIQTDMVNVRDETRSVYKTNTKMNYISVETVINEDRSIYKATRVHTKHLKWATCGETVRDETRSVYKTNTSKLEFQFLFQCY
jgi:hypothetical protein